MFNIHNHLYKWLRLQNVPYDKCRRTILWCWCTWHPSGSCVFRSNTQWHLKRDYNQIAKMFVVVRQRTLMYLVLELKTNYLKHEHSVRLASFHYKKLSCFAVIICKFQKKLVLLDKYEKRVINASWRVTQFIIFIYRRNLIHFQSIRLGMRSSKILLCLYS